VGTTVAGELPQDVRVCKIDRGHFKLYGAFF